MKKNGSGAAVDVLVCHGAKVVQYRDVERNETKFVSLYVQVDLLVLLLWFYCILLEDLCLPFSSMLHVFAPSSMGIREGFTQSVPSSTGETQPRPTESWPAVRFHPLRQGWTISVGGLPRHLRPQRSSVGGWRIARRRPPRLNRNW